MLAEGKAMGKLTDAPRGKKSMHSAAEAAPRRVRNAHKKTHLRREDGEGIALCGSVAGTTLKFGLRIVEKEPSCEVCAELAAKQTEEMSEPAKALAATWMDAEPLTWAQKVVIPGSPENLDWHADLVHRREYPYIDPNENDDSEDCSEDEEEEDRRNGDSEAGKGTEDHEVHGHQGRYGRHHR